MQKANFSFVIPVSDKDSKFLRRAILSIKEQDYKDVEIIVVSTPNTDVDSVCKDENVHLITTDKTNASAKRNIGFDKSKGDYLWFFDCDSVLLPGMLRLIKDTFEDNPDASFVYGAYRFNNDHMSVFPSHPFDSYLLKTMNYICTMSPIKRDVFPRFNEDLDYFQDWDLFIRIADAGHEGAYLRDVIFLTEEPSQDSISGKKDVPFWEKVKHVRKINKIPERKICLTTLGAPYQTIQRAKLLDADYIGCHMGSDLVQLPSQFGHDYKMLYVMGFYPQTINDHAQIFSNAPKDCLKVIQWIGTDVYQLRTKFNWESIKYIREHVLKYIDFQLCNSESLERELGELGIKAHTVYMPLLEDFDPMPYPEKFTVGVYYSDSNPMHNEGFMVDIAKAMPDIDFKFFGGSKVGTEDNIEYVPRGPIKDIIAKCTVNVRMSVHDGYPHTPIHFILGGRGVITNYDMPFVNFLPLTISKQDYGKCKIKLVERIRKFKKDFSYQPNVEAIKYYKDRLDKDKYKNTIHRILEKGKDYIFNDIVYQEVAPCTQQEEKL